AGRAGDEGHTAGERPGPGSPPGGLDHVLRSCCDKTKHVFSLCQTKSPRRRKAEDAEVFAALVRVMQRRGPAELTLREIAAEAGVTAAGVVLASAVRRAAPLRP